MRNLLYLLLRTHFFSKMYLIQSREKCNSNKDTRWDRIRKRHINANAPFKSPIVRQFIETDYIAKKNKKWLLEDNERDKQLDPTMIMNIRHEMFKKIPHKLPIATVRHNGNINTCKAHNMEAEKRYVINELNKLRQQFEKNYKRHEFRMKSEKPNLKMDNEVLLECLEKTSKHIHNFYTTPMKALGQAQVFYAVNTNVFNNASETEMEVDIKQEFNTKLDCKIIPNDPILDTISEKILRRCTSNPLTLTEEFCKPMQAVSGRQVLQMRNERFEELHNIQRSSSTCSNLNDSIDSVIYDLTEDTLLELQLNAEQELQDQKFLRENCSKIEEFQKAVKIEKVVAMSGNESTKTNNIEKVDKDERTQKNVQKKPDIEALIIRHIEVPNIVFETRRVKAIQKPIIVTSEDEETVPTLFNQEQNQIITTLFQVRTQKNKALLSKYFNKWIHFTTIEKLERENCKIRIDRVQKINAFLDKIRKEKKRTKTTKNSTNAEQHTDGSCNKKSEERQETIKITKQFRNKIKVQQDIIDLQRIKLERQERLIMELKLNKLTGEANVAHQELKQELKNVIRCGDPKSKAKAKCLQLIGNLRDEEDEAFQRLQGKALLQPKFLQNMQERALERSVRHEQARQRRMQAEAEREAERIATEEAKRLEDEEAKRLRIEILKQKRRQERMAKILRERERQRAIENRHRAQKFCRRLLLRRIGIESFKRLLQRKRNYMKKCEALRRKIYLRTFFNVWKSYTDLINLQKLCKAKRFYNTILKREAISCWKKFIQREHSKMLVAIDWHALKLIEFWFARWIIFTQHERFNEETKVRQAIAHHEWHLKWKVLDCWQRLPHVLKIEKETEERRQRWRMKIWELLPDYTPNRDSLW